MLSRKKSRFSRNAVAPPPGEPRLAPFMPAVPAFKGRGAAPHPAAADRPGVGRGAGSPSAASIPPGGASPKATAAAAEPPPVAATQQPTGAAPAPGDAPKPDAAKPDPAKPDDHYEERLAAAQTGGGYVRRLTMSKRLHLILGGDASGVTRSSAHAYVTQLIHDAGEPTDPVEQILLEQLMLAHHRLAQLHERASEATRPEAVRILNGAAARLLGELRRLALSIRLYRAPMGSRTFSVVHQQNVVAGAGSQDVKYVDQSAGRENITMQCQNKLNGKTDGSDNNEEPESRRRWADQRLQAAAVDA